MRMKSSSESQINFTFWNSTIKVASKHIVSYYVIVSFYIYIYLHHIQDFKHVKQPSTTALKIAITDLWLKSFKNNYMKDVN